MNFMKVAFLMALLIALFMGIGYLVGGQAGMMIAFIFAVVMNFGSYWFSDKLILKMYRTRPITENDNPRLYRVVRRVSTAANIPMPKVAIIPTRAANAFATGRNVQNATVAASEGLLEMLNEDELEGVMGHEVAHVVNRDMLIGTIAATFAGAIGMLASMAQWAAILGTGRSDERGGSAIGLLVTAIVAPLAAMVLQTAISRQREYKADAVGGSLTGKYLPLANALRKLHNAPVQMAMQGQAQMATANLMIANPLAGRGLANLFSTHPPYEERVRRLQELAQTAPYKGYA